LNSDLEEVVAFIKTGSKFIIAGHKEPDGDCIGSQLALRSALLRLGKEVTVCSAGPFNRTEIKSYAEFFVINPTEEKKPDVKVIIVDCSGRERTGSLEEYISGLPYAIIDHHATGRHPSTPEVPAFIDASSPACTLLIEKIINALGLELTAKEAALLFFGLCTDTGFFRHLTEKNSSVFEAAARMVRCGASPKNTFHVINGGKSLDSRILLGHILTRTESHFEGRLLISYETFEEFNTFGFESRDSDSLNQMLQSVSGVEAFAIIRQELADKCTVSLRSIDKIDTGRIAASMGGGGHKNAAGLTLEGKISYIKEIILKAFQKVFERK
jgi:phosphoesterase RecJ-like protein